MATWPRPPVPMTTAYEPPRSFGSERLIAWYGVRPASVSGTVLTGSRSPIGTRWRGESTIMNSANAPGAPRPGRIDAEFFCPRTVVFESLRAVPTAATAPGSVDDDIGSDVESFDALADGGDPAGAFVAERERKAVGVLLFGQAHDEVVRVADAGSGDFQEHFTWTGLGFGNLREFGFCADSRVLDCLHTDSFVVVGQPVLANAWCLAPLTKEYASVHVRSRDP